MSKTKTFKDIYDGFRGDVPLRNKQVHKNRKDKRNQKWWKDERRWEAE